MPRERKNIVDKGNNTERWKAVKGLWVGSSKNNGKSGCGVVIKGVDRDKWATISKIAVALGAGTAMAAGLVGVCVLPGILDLVLHKSLSVEKSSLCIDAVLRNHCCGPFSQNRNVPKEWKKTSDCVQMLQKRASPKFGVESMRHSDKSGLRLVPSEIYPENLPGRSQPVLPCEVQNTEHYRERDKCFTTKGLESSLISRKDPL